jgi:hypothetical protein
MTKLEEFFGTRLTLGQRDRLNEALGRLSQSRYYTRYVQAFARRYGVIDDQSRTLKDVGVFVGNYKTGEPLSKERARQMVARVERRLRKPDARKFILDGVRSEDWLKK